MANKQNQNAPKKFRDLNFGDIDAAKEAAEMPDLLLNGYYDYREAAYGIEMRKVWLLLGPKGSGKTAVLEHIGLKWDDDPERFYTSWNLSGFPVNDVTNVDSSRSKGAARTQAAWEFILLLRLLISLNEDTAVTSNYLTLSKLINTLTKQGFIAKNSAHDPLRWHVKSLKMDLKVFAAEFGFNQTETTPLESSPIIKRIVQESPSESRHLIAIDGLDSFFFEDSDEWNSLAGLIQAVDSLNTWMSRNGLIYSFITAVRSDIFDLLPAPDTNKLKNRSIHLDWNSGGIGPQNKLWELVKQKVAVGDPTINIFSQFFGETKVWVYPDIVTLILDHTRLLPRDVIAALGYLQLEYNGSSKIPEMNAKRAIKRYCDEYFVGEVFDNLAGILPANKARSLGSFRDALRTAPSRFFDFDYMLTELDGELMPSEIGHLLKQMFNTGALGIKNGAHTDFAYRNIGGAGFSRRPPYVLHDALTRAWNRPWK